VAVNYTIIVGVPLGQRRRVAASSNSGGLSQIDNGSRAQARLRFRV
jgi:hypothetical protein